jgi:hypothetical protein
MLVEEIFLLFFMPKIFWQILQYFASGCATLLPTLG